MEEKKIHVLEVLDCYYPKFDGPNMVITSYANSFTKSNKCQVEAVVPSYPKYTDNQIFDVKRVASVPAPEGYRLAMPWFDRKIKKWLDNQQIDIIHIHSPFSMCRFFAKYAKKRNIPSVYTFHTKFREDFERTVGVKPLVNIAMRYIMSNMNLVDHALTVSYSSIDCMRDYGYKKPVDVIRNGTDLSCPANAEALKKKVQELHQLADDDFVLLSVGRIVENKNLQLVVDALGIVKEKGHSFKLIVVGAGPYEQTLKQLVESQGLSDAVIFTGKVMDRELLSAYYLRANLFCLPSTFDTASLAPIEAAAMKLPSILVKGCSTAEIISHKENGLLADENPHAWAESIMSAITDKEMMQRLSDNCHQQVFRTWDQVADEVYAYYERIINERKK